MASIKKSEIVVAVILQKSRLPVTEKEVLRNLSEHLSGYSLDIERWDEGVEEPLARSIIRNMGFMKADIPMRLMIRELDIILQRVMS